MFDLPEEYALVFSASGRDIKLGIVKKLKELGEEIDKLYLKIHTTVNHPQLDDILEHSELTFLLYPVRPPEEEDSEETWKLAARGDDSYKNELLAGQMADKYHGLVDQKKILEVIDRNLDPGSVYELSTGQLMLFGL